MIKKRCSNCDKKIERSFRFCPWCGKHTKNIKQEDYGMLGFDDNLDNNAVQNPFSMFGGGLGGMLNQLTKQLTRELQNLNLDQENEGLPKGIEIRFSSGKPINRVIKQPTKVQEIKEDVSEQEKERRKGLPIESADSKIRRLPEGLVYEIEAPGIRTKKDVSIMRMENSIEIKAYSKDKCYIKTIPLNVDVFKYGVKEGKVLIQIKN